MVICLKPANPEPSKQATDQPSNQAFERGSNSEVALNAVIPHQHCAGDAQHWAVCLEMAMHKTNTETGPETTATNVVYKIGL